MEEDGVVKASSVAVAAGHTLHLLDLGVEVLGLGVGDAEHVGVEDADQVVADRSGDAHHRLKATPACPVQPCVPRAPSPAAGGVAPDLAGGFLERPCLGGPQAAVLERLETVPFARAESLVALEPEVLRALEAVVAVAGELAVLLATGLRRRPCRCAR